MNNRRSNTNDVRMRQRIAAEAARIMSEEHLSDFYRAKHKAAARLGAANTRNLPRNDEIEKALVEYQKLFRADSQPVRLKTPAGNGAARHGIPGSVSIHRLVGSVLRGTADEHTEITLHVFADTPEEIGLFLMEQGIPYQHGEKRVMLAGGESAFYPAYRFIAEEVPMCLVVFPTNGIRHGPAQRSGWPNCATRRAE